MQLCIHSTSSCQNWIFCQNLIFVSPSIFLPLHYHFGTLPHCNCAGIIIISIVDINIIRKLFFAATLPHLHSPLELILRWQKNRGRAQYRDQLQTTLQRKPNNAVLHKWKRKERQDILWSKESTTSRICIFFDKSKNTQEIQGQWLGYLSQQQGAWELFWTKIKIWPSQWNWVSKAFFNTLAQF